MGTGTQQSLHLRQLSQVAVAVLHARPGAPVDFPEIDIVPQPQHEVGVGSRNRVEDAVAAAIGLARPVVFRLVDEAAGSDRHGEGWRVKAVLPQRLGLEPEGVRVDALGDGLTVEDDLISVGGARFEAAEIKGGGVGRSGARSEAGSGECRIHHGHRRGRSALDEGGPGGFGLNPDARIAQTHVAHHGLARELGEEGTRDNQQEQGEQQAGHVKKGQVPSSEPTPFPKVDLQEFSVSRRSRRLRWQGRP